MGRGLVARGGFSIIIAGLAVTAGIEPSLEPLATAPYVLILVILGPLTARWTEPLATWLAGRLPSPAPPGRAPAEREAEQFLAEPHAEVGGQDAPVADDRPRFGSPFGGTPRVIGTHPPRRWPPVRTLA